MELLEIESRLRQQELKSAQIEAKWEAFFDTTMEYRKALGSKIDDIFGLIISIKDRCIARSTDYEYFLKHLKEHEEQKKVLKKFVWDKSVQLMITIAGILIAFFLGRCANGNP